MAKTKKVRTLRDSVVASAVPVAVEAKAVVAPPKRPPTGRLVSWAWRHPSGLHGVVEVIDGKQLDYYFTRVLSAVRCRMTKLETNRETTYDVVVPPPGADSSGSCGCDGYVRRKACRHIEAVVALRDANRI